MPLTTPLTMRKNTRLVAAAATVSLLATGMGASGAARADQAPPAPKTIASGLITPLRAAVAPDGTAYVSQNFAGSLVRVVKGKKPKVLYQDTGGAEVGAVSLRGTTVTFATTPPEEMPPDLRRAPRRQATPSAKVWRYDVRSGKVRKLADIGAFEAARNPDTTTYGIGGLDESCADELESAGLPFLLPYSGEVYSHPYASVADRKRTYVADAGANDVVSISRGGRVRLVAVLPPVRVMITEDVAAAMSELIGAPLPECAIGHTYRGEPVPTDIELGADGRLYVSTLGGAAGEVLPVGAVYRIDPASGRTRKVMSGLTGATGLAITPRGRLFVSELFSGRIRTLAKGATTPRTFTTAGLPGELEIGPGGLWATVGVLAEEPPFGSLVRFRR